ncbi:hypothetical protein N7522_005617 [Penicillium canescens]|nr:hypothetical protein N7522_005617 [Penicillium canescens]
MFFLKCQMGQLPWHQFSAGLYYRRPQQRSSPQCPSRQTPMGTNVAAGSSNQRKGLPVGNRRLKDLRQAMEIEIVVVKEAGMK